MSKTTSKPNTGKLKHIITLGGGGFSMETPVTKPTLLDDYILRLTGKRKPKVCFIGTASGDSPTYIEKFTKAFKERAETSALLLFNRAVDPLEHLLAQDVIYVGGGNTANLLAVWRLHAVDKALRAAWNNGTVLCGISAGMNCWYEGCSTDSFGPLAPLGDGLGFIEGAACPHFDGEAERRPSLKKFVASGRLPTTYAADDYAAFHFTAEAGVRTATLHRCIKSRVTAGCYVVSKSGKSAEIEALPTELLTGK